MKEVGEQENASDNRPDDERRPYADALYARRVAHGVCADDYDAKADRYQLNNYSKDQSHLVALLVLTGERSGTPASYPPLRRAIVLVRDATPRPWRRLIALHHLPSDKKDDKRKDNIPEEYFVQAHFSRSSASAIVSHTSNSPAAT